MPFSANRFHHYLLDEACPFVMEAIWCVSLNECQPKTMWHYVSLCQLILLISFSVFLLYLLRAGNWSSSVRIWKLRKPFSFKFVPIPKEHRNGIVQRVVIRGRNWMAHVVLGTWKEGKSKFWWERPRKINDKLALCEPGTESYKLRPCSS